MDNLSTIDMANSPVFQAPTLKQPNNQMERILLTLIAAIGLLGSAYIFLASSSGQPDNNFNSAALASVAIASDGYTDTKTKFSDFIEINGDQKANEKLTFSCKMDRDQHRYVIEMGDENRMIITVDEFPYSYKKPGKYFLELKRLEGGLLRTVATKKLKIKK